jgi:hypothetical protein
MSIYAFTDVHGQYGLWDMIKNHCKEDDTIYFLGDACDRGPDSIKIIKELLTDPRVIYLKGNHEELLETIVPELFEGGVNNFTHWLNNGGGETWEELSRERDNVIKEIIHQIKKLPYTATYKNTKGQHIFLSHSGAYRPFPLGRYHKWNIVPDEDLYLWDRTHIKETEWDYRFPKVYVVHGHTPVQLYFKSELPYSYCENHKIDLDLASFDTKKIALLDLDTFEYHIFEDTPFENN